MNPFEAARNVAGFWNRSGEAYLRAQNDLLSGMARWPGDPAAAPTMPEGSEAPPAPTPMRSAAERAFEKTWSTAQDVADTALAHVLEGETGDAARRRALTDILDPTAWFAVPGPAGDPMGLRESPDAAIARRGDEQLAALTEAWAELRRRSLDHGTLMLEAWMQAAGTFARFVTKAARDGASDDLVALWVETANTALGEARRSTRFDASRLALLAASDRLRHSQREFGEFLAQIYGQPSRAEIEDLRADLASVRAELQRLSRQAAQTRAAETESA